SCAMATASRSTSRPARSSWPGCRSEEHTSELQSHLNLVCRLLLEKKDIPPRDPRNAPVTWFFRTTPAIVRLMTRDVLTDADFFNDTAPTEIYTLSLHDALPI